MSHGLTMGFSNPAIDSQLIFRAVMNALARPGSIQALSTALAPPAPLMPELAAIALTLVDHEAPLWLDRPLAAVPEVASYFRFHTGAPIVENPIEAAFALIADPTEAPNLDRFAPGVPDYPDRSTTVVFALRELSHASGLRLEGPGIAERSELKAAPLPVGFSGQMSRNKRLFPMGIDCLFVAPGRIAGLPRTTRIVEETA